MNSIYKQTNIIEKKNKKSWEEIKNSIIFI